eukprot:1429191-Alexandrium_andersonii.AAC.1
MCIRDRNNGAEYLIMLDGSQNAGDGPTAMRERESEVVNPGVERRCGCAGPRSRTRARSTRASTATAAMAT